MTSLLPLASYNLALTPFTPTQAIESDLPVTVHITLAAIDPTNPVDDDQEPSTLRILKSSVFSNLDDDSDEEYDELDDDEVDATLENAKDSDEDDDEDVEDAEESDDSNEDDEDEDDLDDDEDDEDDDVEEFVVCTLGPKSQYQQSLDITISPDEEVYFVVTGSYPIHISGNYVEHPYDAEDDDFDSDEEDDEEFYDDEIDSEDEHDLTPDEDELVENQFDINDLEDDEDVEAKIEELIEAEAEEEKAEEPKLSKKAAKKAKKEAAAKRKAEEEEAAAKPSSKKQKQEEKNVQFNKELEQGPTKAEKAEKPKPSTKTLAGGIVIEDRTVGKGPVAKNGSRVGVRYIGKLKNGSVFDKNTSGKPFTFGLGKGEVIKGWDIGVAGMAVGGERRIVIPPAYAYGKKKLPGIPANSELTFDVKLVSLK